jgi:hypothetical protein
MESQPKKRGRKPKKKIEEENNLTSSENVIKLNINEISTDIIPVKKKRGRKPKPKPNNEEVKIPKKRGRKPKEIFKPSEPSNTTISEEAVILHLNIKNNNSSILNIEDEFVKYNPNINIPVPFIPEDLDNAFYLKTQPNENNNEGSNLNNLSEQNNQLNMESNLINEKSMNEQPLINQTQSINETGNKTNVIVPNDNNLMMNINNNTQNSDIYDKYQKKHLEFSENFTSEKNRCMPIFIEFLDANRKESWPSQTNIDCLWCNHPFDNQPFGIPIKKIGEKYQMFGNFCCAECAASYIYEMPFLNDCEKTESYSLLNYIYNEEQSDGIKFAPSKLSLKRFGGRLTIDQYRNNLRTLSKDYNIIIPPLTSIIPNIEETNISKNLTNINSSILNDSIVSKTGELLRLKRMKPLPDSNNTLEACMNLKLL